MRRIVTHFLLGVFVVGGLMFGAREAFAGQFSKSNCPWYKVCTRDADCAWMAGECGMSTPVCLITPPNPSGCCVCWHDM